jgi:hypothetical protein
MNARLPILTVLALAAAACTKTATQTQPMAQEPAYTFPHATHVDAEVACTECHAGIERADRLQARVRHVVIPPGASKRDACSGCHDKDPVLQLPVRESPPRLTFSHAHHLKLVGGECRTCHRELPEVGDAQPRRPPMEACTSCHQHQREFAEARCRPCHLDLKGYVPRTAFQHVGDWRRTHGALARPSAESCAQCHDQTYCADCHSAATAPGRPSILYPERVERDFIHRGDYVSRHVVDAGANPASCRRCHGSGFCDACHTQQSLTRRGLNVRDPHPPGWATNRASGNFHGDAARRDITACAGCHDRGADATCVGCHRVGGPAGTSPHSRKFRSTRDTGDIAKNSMCRACHT